VGFSLYPRQEVRKAAAGSEAQASQPCGEHVVNPRYLEPCAAAYLHDAPRSNGIFAARNAVEMLRNGGMRVVCSWSLCRQSNTWKAVDETISTGVWVFYRLRHTTTGNKKDGDR
jgi:hypothetical protein